MRFFLLFLLSFCAFAEIRIVDNSTRVSVASWTVGAYPQLTTNEPHSFKENDPIYIIGFTSQFSMNGHQRVHSVIDSKNFTIKTQDGKPLNTWGAKTTASTALENNHSINQKRTPKEYAYVGKTIDTRLTPHPRGWYPKDPALRSRLTDPDKTGSASAPAMSTEHGAYITTIANNWSDAGACKPESPLSASNCAQAHRRLLSTDANAKYGYGPWVLAFAWSMNQQNSRWRNFALAYIYNMHLVAPQGRGFFTAIDPARSGGGVGEDADFASLVLWYWSAAFTLMRDEMPEPQRVLFAKKLIWDKKDGCVNPAGDLNDGMISAFSRWRKKDDQLKKIEVSNGVGTIYTSVSVYGMTPSQSFTIKGASERSLNGTFTPTSVSTAKSEIVFKAPGVPNGTYQNTELVVENFFLAGDTAIVTDTSKFRVGQRLFIRGFSSHLTAEDIQEIVVSGTEAKIHLKMNMRGSNITPVSISGSRVNNLDGSYVISTTNGRDELAIKTTGVPAGKYQPAQGISIYTAGAANRYSTNTIVREIASPTELRLTNNAGAWKSDFGIIPDYHENMCGVVTVSKTHPFTSPLDYRRMGRLPARTTITPTQTEILVQNQYASHLEGLEPPFYLMMGSEVAEVKEKHVTKDITTPLKLNVERGKWGTIPQRLLSSAVLGFSVQGNASSLQSERNTWVGSANQNLTITRFALCSAYLTVADILPSAKEEAEKWCNTFLLYQYQYPREYWAGNTSSSTNIGYHYGRQIFFVTQNYIALMNSLEDSNLGSQMWGPWSEDLAVWALHAKYPMRDNTRFMMSDAGMERNFQARNILPPWMRYIHPTQESDQLNFFYRNILGFTRNMVSAAHYRTLPLEMAYNPNFQKTDDYRTSLPLGHIFTSPFPGSREAGKGIQTFHSRTDWNDYDAEAVYGMAVSPNSDHTGQRNLPGAYQIIRRGELMCVGLRGCVGGSGNTGLIIQSLNSMGSATGPYLKAEARVLLRDPAPAGGATVELTQQDEWLTVPRYITVPAGEKIFSFPTWGYQNPSRKNHYIKATSKNTKGAWVSVANGAGGVGNASAEIAKVTVEPAVSAGHFNEVTVTLAAPAPGGGVNLVISTSGALAAPKMARIRQGQRETQFAISAPPNAGSEGILIVASANEIKTPIKISKPEQQPQQADITAISWASPDTTHGVLAEQAITRVRRKDVGDDYTYWQVQGNRDANDGAYCMTVDLSTGNCTAGTTSHHHIDMIHLRPRNGQSYVVSHTTHIGSDRERDLPGYQRIFRVSHYRGNGDPNTPETGEVPTKAPEDTGFIKGNDITFTKENTNRTRPGGATLHTRMLLPADPSALFEEGIVGNGFGYRAQIWLGSGKAEEGPQEVLLVSSSHPGKHTTSANSSLIPNISDHSVGVLINESPSHVVTFPRKNLDGIQSLKYSVQPNSAGLTKLTSIAQGTYSVLRNGSALVQKVCVDREGVLTFEHPAGAGSYEITQTSAAPCKRPNWWITSTLPSGIVNIPYEVNLATAEGKSTYSIVSGSLPEGTSLSPAGSISGSTKKTGTYQFTVDARSNNEKIQRQFTLQVDSTARAPQTQSVDAEPVEDAADTEEDPPK